MTFFQLQHTKPIYVTHKIANGKKNTNVQNILRVLKMPEGNVKVLPDT